MKQIFLNKLLIDKNI